MVRFESLIYLCDVNELAKHIEYLLLENDCVVVPQFGGFITQHVKTERVEAEELFLPPLRTLRFNPDMQTGDGLLVQSIMNTYAIDECEAKRKLNSLVLSLRQELLENGTCDFGNLGVLSQDEDGEITFMSCQGGAVCPDFYGLDAFRFPLLKEEDRVEETSLQANERKTFITSDDDHIVIRINRRVLNYVTTTAAVILLFLMFSTTAQNTSIESKKNMNTAAMYVPSVLFENTITPLTEEIDLMERLEAEQIADAYNMDYAEPVAEKEVHAEKSLDSEPIVEQKIETITETPQGYAVVLASAIPEKNALNYIKELEQQGVTGATIYKNNRMLRVVLVGFPTESEAFSSLYSLRENHSGFEHAWVYKLK